MKISLIVLDPTKESFIKKGLQEYISRLKHYVKFEYLELTVPKNVNNLPKNKRLATEAEILMSAVPNGHSLYLLDENGKSFNSKGFAKFIQQRLNAGGKGLVFAVGGPFGFDDSIYNVCDGKIALSDMTFTHDMVRLIFTEQLYRAFTIIKGEKYHHD